jgi:hypothetical protein
MDASAIARRSRPVLLGLGLVLACSDVRVVGVEVSTIELEPATLSILIGDTVRLEAKILDAAGNRLRGHLIEWSSSDPVALDVNGDGLIRGLAAGEALVTATTGGQSASAEVVVQRPAPVLTSLHPSSAQRLQSVDLVVNGSGFVHGLSSLSLGPGVAVSRLTVESPTRITATVNIASNAPLGARDVTVTVPPPGGGTARLAAAFTVRDANPAPAVTGADPEAVQRRDRRDVALTGTGFLPGLTSVSFGPNITVHGVTVHGPTSLTANITIGPEATLGSRDISVTNPAPGGGTGTLRQTFTVLEENPAPTATRAIPDVGPRGTTRLVTILGSGFVQGLTAVSFGEGITVNSVTVVFWTSLTASITIAPGAAVGPRDVSVTNPTPGGGTFIMPGGFTVLSGGG